MKPKIFTLIAVLIASYSFTAAQFVREYNPGATSNLVFTGIAKAQNGNYFISGLQDTSIYLSEVNAAGTVIREKLIGIGTNYYRLSSMIVDGDGNIVIVGMWRLAAGGILHAFVLKASPVLGLISHLTYNNAVTSDGMAFTDIKDYKTTGVNNAYYITGYTTGNAGWNAVLTKIDRTTGAIIAIFHGRPIGVSANNVQSSYASLVLDTAANAASPGGIYVSAPLNSGSLASNRPWVAKHNIGTLAFTRAERYLRDILPSQTASLYNIGMAKDNLNLLYCWYGSPNVASNNTHSAMGLTKVNSTTLAPVWQKAYSLTPVAAAPFKYLALTKVENDANGYLTRGNWFDGINEGGGEVFLIRTDKNGSPLWARQYKNVSNVQSFNSSFIIDGTNIFAVGYRTGLANKRGILIITPLSTGSMDTACARPLTVGVADSSFAKVDNLQTLTINNNLQNSYYPINCVTTVTAKPCNDCKSNPVTLSSDFTLTAQLIGNFTTFSSTASAFNTGNNSQFVVSQVNTTTFVDITGTVLTVPTWGGPGLTTSFPPYIFTAGFLYRVRHIVSAFDNCGILKADTTSKLVFLAPGLMSNGNSKFTIINEKGGTGSINNGGGVFGSAELTSLLGNTGVTSVYPNPANAAVTFNMSAVTGENAVIKIVNGSGQTILSTTLAGKKQPRVDTHAWSNGLYLYSITTNGKTVAQGKFVVQH